MQNFDKHFGTVVRTATDLSWGVFEGTYFCKRRSLKFVFQHSAKTLLLWQHFLARLSKVHSSFPQEHFQNLSFYMKTQNPILSFGMNQNISFIARRFSARLPKLHSKYADENFQEMKSTEVILCSELNSKIERNFFHSVVKTALYMFRLTFSGRQNLSKNLNLQLNSKVEKKNFLASSSKLDISSPDKILRQN